MIPIRSERQAGFSLIELFLGTFLGLMILLFAGVIYVNMGRAYRARSGGVMSQQDLTLLSNAIGRRLRAGSSFSIYRVPDREAPVDSGNGLALYDATGARTELLEWSAQRSTVVDSTGTPVSAAVIDSVRFRRDPDNPRLLCYSYSVDNGGGRHVMVQCAAGLRN